MFKSFLKTIIYFIIIVIIIGVYCSVIGIETNKFNKLITNKIFETQPNLKANIKKVKVFLNIKNFSLNIKVFEPDLFIKDKFVRLHYLTTDLSIIAFINKEFSIKNLEALTKDNNVKDLITIARNIKGSGQLLIIDNFIKQGKIQAKIKLNFKENGKIKNDFFIDGQLKNTHLKLLNKNSIKNINLNFEFVSNKFNFKKLSFEYKGINFISDKISIINKKESYFVDGEIETSDKKISDEMLSYFNSTDFLKNILDFKNIIFGSKNNFSFKINNKLKISDFKLISKINLDQLNLKTLFKNDLEKYIDGFENEILFKNNLINLVYEKDKFSFDGAGEFFVNDNSATIDYSINSAKKIVNFKTNIQIKEIPLKIDIFNYQNIKNKKSSINILGVYKPENKLIIKKFSFKENNNEFNIKNLKLKDNKFTNLDELNFSFFKHNELNNHLKISRKKNKYNFSSDIIDISKILENYIKSDDDKKISDVFQDLNSVISIDFRKTYLNNESYLRNLNGNIEFKKNKLIKSSIKSNFNNGQILNFSVSKNAEGEKVTTFFSGNAKPIIDKYKFIKGFSEGELDFYSIEKNNESKSKLKIVDFRLQELPILTKILTLASLQGIADLLAGEGIGFNEFEMDFISKNNLMTIEEIYAIGPAISILMDGYIEKGKLVSLRGTLVPATTLNKVIGSIPLLGDILVGKKTGEGVFGVSFKIKGHPKDLKTTVNPIKTLTPRFITRTLEKIKKN